MKEHPLLPMPKTSPEINDSYALLGRSLSYSTDFENNCRELAHLTDVVSMDGDFSYELYLQLRSGSLHKKIKMFKIDLKLPSETEEKIHAARESRNRLVHVIALGHEEALLTTGGRWAFRCEVTMCMRDLISGNQLVLDITRIVKEGRVKGAHGSDTVSYFFTVYDWLVGKS